MKVAIYLSAACWAFGAAIVLDGTQAGISLFSGVLLFALGLAEVE